MHTKSILASTFLVAGYVHAASSGPPACLLSALNTQTNPADITSVCGNSAVVENAIASACGANAQNALNAYVANCAAKGVNVPTTLPTTAPDSTPTSTGTSTGSGSGGVSGMSGSNDNTGGSPVAVSFSGVPTVSESLNTSQTGIEISGSQATNTLESGSSGSPSPGSSSVSGSGSSSGSNSSSGSGSGTGSGPAPDLSGNKTSANKTSADKKSMAVGKVAEPIGYYTVVFVGFIGAIALLL